MSFKRLPANSRQEIDLSGPQGNAFFLLGLASNYAEELGMNGKTIQTEMRSGNYVNLVNVFNKHFGEYVDLLIPPELEAELGL